MKYYKGTNKDNHREVVIRVFDEPQNNFMNDRTYIAEVTDVLRGKHNEVPTQFDLDNHYYLSREIGENEYNFFCTAGKLLTEIWMNQFTGGFPIAKSVLSLERKMHSLLKSTLNDMGCT